MLPNRLDLEFAGVVIDLRTWSIALLAIYLVKGLGAYFSAYLMTDVGAARRAGPPQQLFRHILDQSAGFFSRRTTGQLMSRNHQRRHPGPARRVGDGRRSACARGWRVVGFAALMF